MRFGRDGKGAVVYVHTDTLPEWVPVAGEGRVIQTWSDGMRDVLRALEDLSSATTAAVADHAEVSINHRQVFDHLETLRERGVLHREHDPEDGRRVRWVDDGLHRVSEPGDVEIEPVELADLEEPEVAALARSTTYYTPWCRNSAGSDGRDTTPTAHQTADGPAPPAKGGEPPPHEAD